MNNQKNKTPQFIALIVAVSFITSVITGFIAGGLISYNILKNNGSLMPDLIGQKSQVITQEEQVVRVVKEQSPAVVSIIVTKDLPVLEQYFEQSPFSDDPFFRQFFGGDVSPFDFQVPQYRQKGTEKKEIGGGTGFIVSQDGMILTNKHVVSDTEAEYTVLTNDGEKISAKVLAIDPIQDIAILKIEKNNLPVLFLGDSDQIQIGQTAIAIGNALGEFRNTVSTGVISGLKRSIIASSGFGQTEELAEVIQTDAAINPGNSGGPLLNLSGEVIGINVAMAQGAENIGFSLPINLAKKDLEQVKKDGKISYPFLGIRYVIIDQDIQKTNNLSVDYGALVVRGSNVNELAVVPGSAADKAGIVENDIILEADGKKIDSKNPLSEFIAKYKVGDTITLKILHKGEEKTVKVILGEWK